MAEKVLSRKEFPELAARDRRAAWEDAERTTEDYSLRVWKMQYLYTDGRSDRSKRKRQPKVIARG